MEWKDLGQRVSAFSRKKWQINKISVTNFKISFELAFKGKGRPESSSRRLLNIETHTQRVERGCGRQEKKKEDSDGGMGIHTRGQARHLFRISNVAHFIDDIFSESHRLPESRRCGSRHSSCFEAVSQQSVWEMALSPPPCQTVKYRLNEMSSANAGAAGKLLTRRSERVPSKYSGSCGHRLPVPPGVCPPGTAEYPP